ncbi:AurF N-oxygenase family protein [Nocardia sp. NBC_01327]|uniref:AurF N-oxygenase family protein n=1 Tax=Nocardia sp. NBC_01327 TaxID=2903593 RepID=UPI002E1333DE|nr:diiron oxygenase [Nocardia sp. NBC_01327]
MTSTTHATSAHTDEQYTDTLATLSEGSVHRKFDPFLDIPWDDPAFAVVPDDERWILPTADPFGAHPWYRALPREKQIAIGMWRQANIAKVGLQFENILIRGLMQYVFSQPNGSPEFRYSTHEAAEECNHTQMFQQVVNRIGVDVPGMSRLTRALGPIVPLVPIAFPTWFFIMVLAGEEPIDHGQKAILRSDSEMHPMITRVMQIHVAEEARHISFAHEYVEHHVPELSAVSRFALSVLTPITMRAALWLIAVPPSRFRREFDVPRAVFKDVYWRSPESRRALSDFFADVRMLIGNAGLMNPVSRLIWKILRIDGRPARYRSEPAA